MPRRRRHQVDLELGGQHPGAHRHQAERGLARRTVRNSADRAGMDKTVLLRDVRAGTQDDLHRARRYGAQLRAQRCHQALFGEAVSDAVGGGMLLTPLSNQAVADHLPRRADLFCPPHRENAMTDGLDLQRFIDAQALNCS